MLNFLLLLTIIWLCTFLLLLPVLDLNISWRQIWFMVKPTREENLRQVKLDIWKSWKSSAKTAYLRYQNALKWKLFTLWQNTKALPGKAKRRIWNKGILLTYHRLWVRKDEFDKSLNMDPVAMMEMDQIEQEKYLEDLVRRRQIAHNRDMAEQDAKY